MKFEGTNGPWQLHDDMKVRGTGDIEGMTVIANVSSSMNYSRGRITQYFNGKLIASAPELLEALTKIANWELPETGKFWDDDEPVSYTAEYGTEGVKEYFKSLAYEAIQKALT